MTSLPARRVDAGPRSTRVSIVTPDGRWDQYVQDHPESSGYHLAGWAGVLESTFRQAPRYLAATRAGHLVGVLPLFLYRSRLFGRVLTSLPTLTYGGVLADDDEAARALLAGAVEEARRLEVSHVELRHTRRVFPDLPAREHKVVMRLQLERSEARQWETLDRKVRNQIRKAGKSGVSLEWGGRELVAPFYDVFARNMRDLGTPVFPRRLFEAVLDTFPQATAITLARHEGRPIAAALVFTHGRVMEVPWASSLRPYNALCGNMAIYWEMVRRAIGSGLATFDLGRTTPDDSTFAFKRQWGATPAPLVWEYWLAPGRSLPDLDRGNPKFGPLIAAWRRLPVGLSRWLGPAIVRHIP